MGQLQPHSSVRLHNYRLAVLHGNVLFGKGSITKEHTSSAMATLPSVRANLIAWKKTKINSLVFEKYVLEIESRSKHYSYVVYQYNSVSRFRRVGRFRDSSMHCSQQ
jgi:hypothetical protein